MSSLRGRTRDSSWQWFLIGFVLASGCASVVCLGGYAAGYVRMPNSEVAASGPTVVVPPPVTAVTAVTQIVVTGNAPAQSTSADNTTPISTDVTGAGGTVEPSITPVRVASPTLAGTNILTPSPTTSAATTPLPGPTINTPVNDTTTLPPLTSSTFTTPTELIPISGGQFLKGIGTTSEEVLKSLAPFYNCDGADKDKCNELLQDANDSMPPFDVVLDSYQIEKYEVTEQQFVDFLNSLGPKSHLSGCDGNPCAAVKDVANPASYITFDATKTEKWYDVSTELYRKRPVTDVTWFGANSYCKALGRRLPTEAEWEHAARGPRGFIYPWGNDWDLGTPRAKTSKSMTDPNSKGGPDPIDSYPNGKTLDGVYNMAGNVSEWVNDWYDSGYYATFSGKTAKNPQGPDSGTEKAYRGGDWDAIPFFARAVQRRSADPGSVFLYLGFRCAADNTGQPTAVKPVPGGGTGATPTPTPVGIVPSKPTNTLSAGPQG